MKIVFLDSLTLGKDIDLSAFEKFGDVDIYDTTLPEDIPARISACDVIITNKVKLGEKQLSSAEKLKLICVCATGYDNIDIEYAKQRGIGVCNVIGYSTDSVAQVTVGSVLALYNSVFEYRDFVCDGSYTASGVANRLIPAYRELSGKVWGVVGCGNIGKKVADIAKAFGCHVIVNKRTRTDEYECTDIDDLCRRSDIITLHVPLNGSTKNLIDGERIAEMKQGVILVNMARGAVTDEGEIAKAVMNGKLGGFASDVYAAEPFPSDHPFSSICKMKNVCLTPHMAWGAYEARVRLCTEVEKNIIAYFDGKMRNRVDI